MGGRQGRVVRLRIGLEARKLQPTLLIGEQTLVKAPPYNIFDTGLWGLGICDKCPWGNY